MFSRILIPLDGSGVAERALAHARAVARGTTATLSLVRVLDTPGEGAVDPLDWQLLLAEAESYLERHAAALREAGLEVETRVLQGRAAEQVLAHGVATGVDLIVLASHGSSGISGFSLSSVAQKIAIGSTCSVAVVRAHRARPEDVEAGYRRILLPLDGSQRAEYALPVATALARAHGARLIAAHVLRPPELPRRTPPSEEDRALAQRLLDRNRSEVERYLDELSGRIEGDAESELVLAEHVAAALEELVQREQIDLVVASAHGYGGTERFPYGSIVTSLLLLGSVPLLVVQDLPPGRSPVQPAIEQAPRIPGTDRR